MSGLDPFRCTVWGGMALGVILFWGFVLWRVLA